MKRLIILFFPLLFMNVAYCFFSSLINNGYIPISNTTNKEDKIIVKDFFIDGKKGEFKINDNNYSLENIAIQANQKISISLILENNTNKDLVLDINEKTDSHIIVSIDSPQVISSNSTIICTIYIKSPENIVDDYETNFSMNIAGTQI